MSKGIYTEHASLLCPTEPSEITSSQEVDFGEQDEDLDVFLGCPVHSLSQESIDVIEKPVEQRTFDTYAYFKQSEDIDSFLAIKNITYSSKSGDMSVSPNEFIYKRNGVITLNFLKESFVIIECFLSGGEPTKIELLYDKTCKFQDPNDGLQKRYPGAVSFSFKFQNPTPFASAGSKRKTAQFMIRCSSTAIWPETQYTLCSIHMHGEFVILSHTSQLTKNVQNRDKEGGNESKKRKGDESVGEKRKIVKCMQEETIMKVPNDLLDLFLIFLSQNHPDRVNDVQSLSFSQSGVEEARQRLKLTGKLHDPEVKKQ